MTLCIQLRVVFDPCSFPSEENQTLVLESEIVSDLTFLVITGLYIKQGLGRPLGAKCNAIQKKGGLLNS